MFSTAVWTRPGRNSGSAPFQVFCLSLTPALVLPRFPEPKVAKGKEFP